MRNRKTKVKWQCGEKEWKEEVPRVIIEKTKTPLSWAWQHPLHQVPPIPPSIHPQAHHPIPSRQGNFLLPTAHPSSIYSSIHLSVPQQMEIITHNNQQFAIPPFSNLTSKSQLLRMMTLLIRALSSVPVGEMDTSESCKECNWQVLVWSSHPVYLWIPHSAGQQSRRLC